MKTRTVLRAVVADFGLSVVKILHVAGAIMWLGGGLLFLLVIHPPIAKRPIRERLSLFLEVTKRGAFYFPPLGFVTILTGFELARQITGTLNPFGWDDGAYAGGSALQAGFIVALVAFAAGGASGPARKQLGKLHAGEWTLEAEARVAKLFTRIHVSDIIDVSLLSVVVVLMVIANLGGF